MDINGKTVVVTGATSGLGQAAAIDFARGGARVFIVGRDGDRANETAERIRKEGGKAEVVIGDVSTRAGVKALAQAILTRAPAIDVLVNNAGGSFKTPAKTSDGVDATFALNTLGAYLLEKELHGAIAAAHGRVVNVVTGFLNQFPVEVDDLVSPRKFKTTRQYARSKHASLMMSVEQARRYEPEGVKVTALHPGIILGTRFGGGQPKMAQRIGGPILRGIGLACTLDEAVRRFRVAAFGDVPTGSYLVKGAPSALPKQTTEAPVREKVVALLDQLAARA